MKNLIYSGLMLLIIVAVTFFISKKTFFASKKTGTVIILNGPSAAGKSSIQKEFQNLMMPNLWIKVGIDNLFDAPMPTITPENLTFWQKPNPIRWVETSQDNENNNLIALFTGPEGERVAYGMNSAIAAYAQAGCNSIVDYIAYKKEWIDDLQQKLKPFKTIWVKINIPLKKLEEREIARGTSPKGHARSHYSSVYWDLNYDLEVDTSQHSAQKIAEKIKHFFLNDT